MTTCSRPRSNHGDGRGCDDDHCPRHGGREFGPITPPADLDPDDTTAYREWWANVQTAIADGDLKPKEIELPQRDVKALTQGAFQRIPGRTA